MKINITLILLVFLSSFRVNGQEYFSVIAENGLVVRTEPKANSERVGKLYCGEPVELIKKTNIKLQLKDNGKLIKGEWYLVESKSRTLEILKGYVFSGYLLKNNDKWNIGWTCANNKIVCSSKITTKH